MDAFFDSATRNGTTTNTYFDMVAFADYWNAPVEIVGTDDMPVIAAGD